MKIRNGFVSNSSSSSFIVIASVTEMTPEIQALHNNGDIKAIKISDILDGSEYPYHCDIQFNDDGSATISDDMTYVDLKITPEDKDLYLVDLYIGSSNFDETEWGEIINVEYSPEDEDLMNIIQKNAVRYEQGDFTGRDG